jgi:hypothetical protein
MAQCRKGSHVYLRMPLGLHADYVCSLQRSRSCRCCP